MLARLRAVVFVLTGIVLLAISGYEAWSTRAFLQSALRTTGRVTALNAGRLHPEIDFVTASGELISYPQGGLLFGVQVGDSVTVLYSANNPAQSATIDAPDALWFMTISLGGLGAAFLIGGTLSFRRARIG